MIWISIEDVILIHNKIIQVTGGIDGLRDRASLEAALAVPLQSFGGQDLYPSSIQKSLDLDMGWQLTMRLLMGIKELVL